MVDGEYLVVHDDVNSWLKEPRGKKTFGQILQTVGPFETKRRHGSGENNRNF